MYWFIEKFICIKNLLSILCPNLTDEYEICKDYLVFPYEMWLMAILDITIQKLLQCLVHLYVPWEWNAAGTWWNQHRGCNKKNHLYILVNDHELGISSKPLTFLANEGLFNISIASLPSWEIVIFNY